MRYSVDHRVHISLITKTTAKKILMMIIKMLKHQQPKNHGHEFVVEDVVTFALIMSIAFHRRIIKNDQQHPKQQQHQLNCHFMM